MKKDGIKIILFGLGLTIISAVFYSFNFDQPVTDKSVIAIGKSYQFNWTPLIGISIMAIGEFILWESQNNKNLNEVRIKFIKKLHMRVSNLRLDYIYLSHAKLLNMKAVRFIISVFQV